MNNPESFLAMLLQPNSVLGILLFLVPGFVAFKLDQQLRPQTLRNATDSILEIIAYSLVNDLLWSPVFNFAALQGFPTSVKSWLFTIVVVVVSPTILTIAYSFGVNVLASKGVIPSPIAKPWDHFFSRVAKGKEIGVILTLRDGARIGGVYRPPAFASSFPANEQLFLAETWLIDDGGGFERQIKDSAGMMIDKDDILILEFYDWPLAKPAEVNKGHG
jgi:hypothetical protein